MMFVIFMSHYQSYLVSPVLVLVLVLVLALVLVLDLDLVMMFVLFVIYTVYLHN